MFIHLHLDNIYYNVERFSEYINCVVCKYNEINCTTCPIYRILIYANSFTS
jgi:hypothetical protein